MKFAAVIAAAGISSRMHEFKPLLPLGEKTIIECVIYNLRQAGAGEIVVVTGYKSELLQQYLEPLKVHTIKNLRFAETKMFESICLGIKALKEPYDSLFLTPGDIPLVSPETLKKMEATNASMVRPIYKGKSGHPVLIASSIVPQILSYKGKGGLRGAMESVSEPISDLPVNDVGITMDADTPEDFKRLRCQSQKMHSSTSFWPEIHIHIDKEYTILTPETAQYLEMIEHLGSIQAACTCMHMSYSRGKKVLNHIERELGHPLVNDSPIEQNGNMLTPQGKNLLVAYQNFRNMVSKAASDYFMQIFANNINALGDVNINTKSNVEQRFPVQIIY